MAFPLFYEASFSGGSGQFNLGEESSRHMIQVLRMKEGDRIQITDGKGNTGLAEIISAGKKATLVHILQNEFSMQPKTRTAIAISLIKNSNRFEWFAEKATEIGITEILPLLCHRTEKTHFRSGRIQSILISAMLQSRQAWLPSLSDPIEFSELVSGASYEQKWIAHCLESDKTDLKEAPHLAASKIILIGPEGDFTPDEVQIAIRHGFLPVSLGTTRLRTETAGMVAAVLLQG